MRELALSTDRITAVGVGTIVALVLAGLIVALIVSKVVIRIVTLVIVVALAVLVWTQRTAVVDAAQDAARRCDITFFGIHVDPANEQVRAACDQLSGP